MTKQPYPEEFKIEAVKQITERGHRVADVSARIGVSQHSLYKWIKAYAVPAPERQMQTSQTEELRRLKAELKRVTEERDILKKAAVSSTRRRNGLAQLSGWRLEAQGLTRSFVETSGDLVQECLRMAG